MLGICFGVKAVEKVGGRLEAGKREGTGGREIGGLILCQFRHQAPRIAPCACACNAVYH